MKDVMFACLTSTICILMFGCKGLTMIMLKKRILFCSKVVIFSLYKLISVQLIQCMHNNSFTYLVPSSFLEVVSSGQLFVMFFFLCLIVKQDTVSHTLEMEII